MLLPIQIALSEPAFTDVAIVTTTITVSVFIQPLALVPVTTYVVVTDGDAVGLAQLVQDKPIDGLHE